MILDKIKFWLHAIRIKFLISSIVSILIGLLINYHHHNFINVYYAILTTCGVVLLHISVDLLNDYWDFKRGIDNKTHRTKFSGGTGILPSGVIKPPHFYFMGMLFLFFWNLHWHLFYLCTWNHNSHITNFCNYFNLFLFYQNCELWII